MADSVVDLESALLKEKEENDASPVSIGDFSKTLCTREKEHLRVVFPQMCSVKWRTFWCASAVLMALLFVYHSTTSIMWGLPFELCNALSSLCLSFLGIYFATWKVKEELQIDRSSFLIKEQHYFLGVPRQPVEVSGSTEELIKAAVAKNLCCCVPFLWRVGIKLHIERKPSDQDAKKSCCFVTKACKFLGPKKVVIALWKLSTTEIEKLVDEINDFLLQMSAPEGQFLAGGATK